MVIVRLLSHFVLTLAGPLAGLARHLMLCAQQMDYVQVQVQEHSQEANNQTGHLSSISLLFRPGNHAV